MPAGSTARGTFMVLLATTLWGVGGLFLHQLFELGLSPVQVAFYSSALAAVTLLVGLLAFAPRQLLLKPRELPLLLALGLLGEGPSFVLYATAVALSGVGTAMLLNYTAPAWVALLAWRFLGEPLDKRRVVALGATLVGCALVARVYDAQALRLSLPGVLAGLGSGLSWAVFQVLGKRALEVHHPLTVSAFTAGAAALALLPLQSAPLPLAIGAATWPWLAAFVLGPNVVAPVLFTAGLRTLLAGLASLLSIWELVIAVLLGVVLLGESLELPQVAGAALLAISVLALGAVAASEPPAPTPLPSEVRARRG